MEAKKDIRKRVLEKRCMLSKEEWEGKTNKIYEEIISHPFFLKAEEVYCYIDFRNEVGTRQIIEKAWELKKKVAVPRIEDDMKFYYISSWDEVKSGCWGILEPAASKLAEGIDVCVIMPGAVFDTKKNRIGYGKGYYDAYLHTHAGYKTVALAFQLQMVEEIPTEPHDICPQVIITEENIYV